MFKSNDKIVTYPHKLSLLLATNYRSKTLLAIFKEEKRKGGGFIDRIKFSNVMKIRMYI